MINFVADNADEELLVGIGLSRKDVLKLQQDVKISINLSSLCPELKGEVLIFFGETDDSMTAQLKRAGLLTDGVEYRVNTQ